MSYYRHNILLTLLRSTICDAGHIAQETSQNALCRKCVTDTLLKGLERDICWNAQPTSFEVVPRLSWFWGLCHSQGTEQEDNDRHAVPC